MILGKRTHLSLSIATTLALLLTTATALALQDQPAPVSKLVKSTTATGVAVRGHVIRLPGAEPNLRVDLAEVGRGVGPNSGVAVGPDGAFEFTNIPPGNYIVRVSALVPTQPIVVGNQDVTGIEFSVPPTRTVAGQILLEDGPSTEIAGQRLGFTIAYPNGSVGIAAILQANGNFSLLVPAGEHRITLNVMPGYTTRSMTFGSIDLLRELLRIDSTNTAQLVVTLARTTLSRPGSPARTPGAFPLTTVSLREPVLLSQIQPEYTDAARKARAMGRVTLRGVVQTNGIMTDIQIVEGLGFGLDENAIAAVQQWRFIPGMRNGEPVATYMSVTLTFSLR